MTREDAISELQAVLDKWFAPKGWLFKKRCDAFDMAITALREPVLDENGLARCGVCGKSPTYEELNDGFFDLDRVECRGCGVMVTSACGKSKAKWNAMRGVKGADE